MAFKSSLFSRSLELAKLTAKMAVKELRSSDLQSRLEQAALLTETLTQLKGAALKAGQLISLELADYFPPEALEILGQLQNKATAAPFSQIEKTIQQELGAQRLEVFTSIDQNPLASASIAQIHRAQLKGQNVVLKVQHEGVSDSIESDIKLLKKISSAFCRLTQRDMDLSPVFSELRDVLVQEIDFEKEALFLQSYQKNIETRPEFEGRYKTPMVLADYSTKKVLTMTWEEGETIPQWLLKNPPLAQKEQLAHLILNLFCHEFFSWGLVQTDPNFSNFLVKEKAGEISLVLLDFGSTRTYDQSMIREYVALLKALEDGSPQKILAEAISFGLIDPREPDEAKALFIQMMSIAVEPFRVSGAFDPSSDEPFNFASSDYSKKSQGVVFEFMKTLKYSPPPHRILFLHRKLGGIFALLKRMDVRIKIGPYWKLMTEDHTDGESVETK